MVGRLLRPENLEVSLKCVLKHATSRGSNTFQLFDTSEKLNHFARQENGQNEWYDLEYQGGKAQALPCPDSTLQTLFLQQSSSSAKEEEEAHRVVMEDRRRRRIAIENLAKGIAMLRRWASLNCKNEWRCLCNSVSPFSKWSSWREVKVVKRFLK